MRRVVVTLLAIVAGLAVLTELAGLAGRTRAAALTAGSQTAASQTAASQAAASQTAATARTVAAAWEPAPAVVIDDFSSIQSWSAHPADGVELSLRQDDADGNPALRLDVHFEGGGYAIARRELDLPLPENYAFTFRVRGKGPSNHLEFKLVDGSGENVWWHVRRDVAFSSAYETFRIKQRQIQFAWGPTGGGEIDTVHAIEFAITAGSGGTGTVWIDDLTLVPLPPVDASPPQITARASTNSANAQAVVDRDGETAWAAEQMDQSPWLLLDLGRTYEFSGLLVDWDLRPPSSYRVELSEDGDAWTEAVTVEESDGARDPLFLPDSEARFLRLSSATPAPTESPEPLAQMAIREIEVVPLDRFPDREAFFHELARGARRGLYPRGIYGEQSYWTVIGLDYDDREVLVGEDGTVELWAGGPSVEPFLLLDGQLVTWADVQSTKSLEDGYLPIPTIRWSHGDLDLEITPLAAGIPGNAEALVRYRVVQRGKGRAKGELVLAVRAFQVNPPSQSLNLKGGTSHLTRLEVSKMGARIERVSLSVQPPAERAGAVGFFGGDVVADHLASGALPTSNKVHDEFGGASGALAFPFTLRSGEQRDVVLRFPLHASSVGDHPRGDHPTGTDTAGAAAMGTTGTASTDTAATGTTDTAATDTAGTVRADATDTDTSRADMARTDTAGTDTPSDPDDPLADFDTELQKAKREWHEKLDRVHIKLPPSGDRYLETMRSQIGFILINRSGPSIQPGVRSYARSWIRDGALTSSALLRVGHATAAIEFLEWYAPHQYENGKIPCVVDHRGADPVPEHDSSGEFIFLVAEILRFTGDRALAERQWPRVLGAARYLDALRHERLDPKYTTPELRAFYGILPPSISHEGYSAKPMHSYWDDFFALKGFRDAAFLAATLGKPEAVELEALAREFAHDLGASIQAAQELHGIDWVPGCADLGDFDATSTTIALSPVGVDGVVPDLDLERTFRRYLEFTRAREATQEWDAYTPYELRNVGVFVRLGWRDEAHDLLDFFFADQRPAGWRSWAEVVAREKRRPRFLGDIPHTWVGSDYIRSFLDMFVATDPDGRFATLGAGVPFEWLEGDGVALSGLPTRFGEIDLRLRRTGDTELIVEIGGAAATPPRGWLVRPPLPAEPRSVQVGEVEVAASREVRVDRTPALVRFRW